MADDLNANINVNIDTKDALRQLRQLQAALSRFNQALTQGNIASVNAQKGLTDQLIQSINATGKFVASQKEIATSTKSFTDALEKNKLSVTTTSKRSGLVTKNIEAASTCKYSVEIFGYSLATSSNGQVA